MKTTIKVILGSLLMVTIGVSGQQMPDYSLYNNNMVLLNPAYAGIADSWSVSAGYRKQWLGIKGAPTVMNFSGHGYLPKYKVGVGLTAWQFTAGAVTQNAVGSSYSYRIQFERFTLNFGLTAQLINFRTNYAGADLNGINDPTFTNDVNQTKFNSGAGVFLYGERFYAGFSVPVLMTYASNANTPIKQDRHFILTGGYLYNINEKFTLKPNALMKIVPGAPFVYNVGVYAYYMEQFGLGLLYKLEKTMAAQLSYVLNKSLYISYAYDLPGGANISAAQNGSHEIVMSYLIPASGTKNDRVRFY